MFFYRKIGIYFICLGFALFITEEGKGEEKRVKGWFPEGFFKITERDYIPGVCRFMFWDHESPKVLFDHEARSFYVNRPLQVQLTRRKELLLRFYSPRPIQNVTVWAYHTGIRERIRLMEFEIIWPFLEFRRLLPFWKKDCKYYTKEGKAVILNSKIRPDELQLEIECNDPFANDKFSLPLEDCFWGLLWRKLDAFVTVTCEGSCRYIIELVGFV